MKLSVTSVLILVFICSIGDIISQEIKRIESYTTDRVSDEYFDQMTIGNNNWSSLNTLKPEVFRFISNNVEGKFQSFHVLDSNLITKHLDENSTNSNYSEHIVVEFKDKFINNIIMRIMKKEKGNESIGFYTSSDEKERHEVNDDLYRYYRLHKNKFISYLKLKNNIELQVGKATDYHSNKTYLSEIDKTLVNSLHLIAINY